MLQDFCGPDARMRGNAPEPTVAVLQQSLQRTPTPHPNEPGSKIMAEAWYRALAGDDARQEIVDRLYGTVYDVDRMMDDHLTWRRGER